MDVPDAFDSVTDAARYVLAVHYRLQARIRLGMLSERTINGTQLASVVMAESILAPSDVAQIRDDANKSIHEQMFDHATQVIYG